MCIQQMPLWAKNSPTNYRNVNASDSESWGLSKLSGSTTNIFGNSKYEKNNTNKPIHNFSNSF